MINVINLPRKSANEKFATILARRSVIEFPLPVISFLKLKKEGMLSFQ